ncbi:ABC transporter ATP-binding protein [Variovorax sp. Sphag1AA]|uniref:ABC transporter ATP-binding protein n=1 Tax=Variovorax sp. Sphag1AA TaxID=2587027 RepID=UPI00161E1B78|nr:ABC transporter ATP-binding protein [Variovorax sp. Sphag1AA]MBB3176971.1 branched-chain amino acid transport system ATP-binding protein [Variovorax sp. Sphag1AA]
MSALLSVRGLGKRFGGLTALNNVSFNVEAGRIVGVMGANGAGKTTLFALIAGNVRPTAGQIEFEGKPIVGLRPDQVCRLGVARTFQIVKPFPSLTVLENLRTGAMFGHAQFKRESEADAACMQVLEEVGLANVAHRPASSLTLSGQKRLEIARCIATGARLVLLDEVMAGLTPTEVAQMLETLRRLQASRGLTLLVIEHVMRALMELCGHIVVLHHGELIAEGTPAQIGDNEKVLSVYFGAHA